MHIKGEINSSKLTGSDFNAPLISMDRFYRQKTNPETAALNDKLDQMDFISSEHFITKQHNIHFSSTPETFYRIDHMLGHKICLNKFNKIEIISSIFSHHNSMKLEIDHMKKNLKNTQTHGS